MSVFALFALTVIPLIFTPGPDMLFILSQVMGKDAKAGMLATVGICLGYLVHSVLVALGIAAIVVSFPVLFESIRWLGIAYLLFLAFSLIKSVFSQNKITIEKKLSSSPIKKGFFTALLNPKGMLIYFAILPQFIDKAGNTVNQGLILSLIFIGLIFVVYGSLSIVFAKVTQKADIDERKQKWIDGASGGLLMLAATWLIMN
ncbi:LysE family translocator [Acinetobacter kookii]|uniref:Threonine/homoserine/homoserine lactone efflux protein n=1 Tax=Acinetobacter kookii TaxID=1226327 RepID=A0A1G6H552_9GAMM|nr:MULTISPECIES: LysE family translocator [Acinetobacter]MCT8089924.1 LysE family translocator [Acinetobacter sp. F_3_1]MCT8098059.1 LysE family translocator [Acinetobacter sp. C_3_1]MCT8100785.1 LysE family translocator [Acinetobacter sp. C_4_1]MCT8134538.1 LysE family translocator [Acinetobacter sp. T_3_1]SDB88586.1 Threonine/homoserine/homoserine lactone efflux protein [Acinetobacter kookii]